MKQRPLKQRQILPLTKKLPSRLISFFIPPTCELTLKDRVQMVPKRNHWSRSK